MSSRPSRGAARLAAILDALPDALVLVNANGTVVNANTIALEAFEAPGTALVGRGLLDLLPQFDSRLIPGSMRRPDTIDQRGRTKPTRMIARRTDGSEFPVEVTSANLENGQQAYDSYGPTPDELLMLVVRDLSGTVDTEAELARSQRQTEMILRAAAEGVRARTRRDGSSSSIRRPLRYWDTGPVISAARTCTPSSSTRARTASPSRTRSPRSPTPCAPGASTGCAGRCCGPSPGTRCRSI